MKGFISILLFFVFAPLGGQINDWIYSDRPYLKLLVANEGFYSVKASMWETNLMPVVSANELQMFRRGKQISIKVFDLDSNNIYDNQDYIVFYGEKNDGYLDKSLYTKQSLQLNPKLNLHSDTSAYFLTYSSVGPWERVSSSGTFLGASQMRTLHRQQLRKDFMQFYLRGENLSEEPCYGSLYEESVGYGSDPYEASVFAFKLDKLVRDIKESVDVKSKIAVFETPNPIMVSQTFKTRNTEQNTEVGLYQIRGLVPQTMDFQIQNSDQFLTDSLILAYTKISGPDHSISMSYIQIDFPQSIFWNPLEVVNKYYFKSTEGEEVSFKIASSNVFNEAWTIGENGICKEVAMSQIGDSAKLDFIGTGYDKVAILKGDPIVIDKAHKILYNRSFAPRKNLFVIVTHESLQKKTKSYDNPIKEYASYRNSLIGGGFDTLIVNTGYLYDYYTFGEINPLAIRLLCEDLCKDTSMVPKGLFLIGKGYNKHKTNRRLDEIRRYSLVPTWGDPGSDVPFSMGLAGMKKYVQAIPTGRLSVVYPQQVEDYFLKILEHEALSDYTPWKKRFIHLSGGGSSSQSIEFKGYMEILRNIVEGPFLGAKVTSYSKTIDQTIQIFDLSKQLDEGAGFVTLFGHSSANFNDVRIGAVNEPSFNYRNKGKYPLIYMNGCESGNIFGYNEIPNPVFSETWVNGADVGSIGFYAHSGIGITFDLVEYQAAFYKNWFNDSLNIDKSFAEMVKITSEGFVENFWASSFGRVRQIHQMTFMGDPQVRLFKKIGLDFSIDASDVSLIPIDNKPITAISDSFALKFVIKNNGIVPKIRNIGIRVKRQMPNGEEIIVANLFRRINKSADTVQLFVKLADINGLGENRFKILLDPLDVIEEVNELNNEVEIIKYLPASDMNCLFPREFSIQSKTLINLVAQSTDLLKTEQEYLFEIDTCFQFNSPVYRSRILKATSLPIWENVDLLQGLAAEADSVEFFWRVKFKAEGVSDDLYANSSFIYIKNGMPGWNQSKYHQFDNDIVSETVLRNKNQKSFEFSSYKLNILAKAGTEMAIGPIDSNQLYINDKPIYSASEFIQFPDWYGYAGFMFAAFDSKTLRIYKPEVKTQGPADWYYPGLANESAIGRFLLYNEVLSDLNRYIEAVPDGDYILVNPVGAVNYSDVFANDRANIEKFISLVGTQKLNNLNQQACYGVFFRKGFGIVKEEILLNPTKDQKFELNVTQDLFYPQGHISSTVIGPANAWGKFYYNVDSDNNRDHVKFSIFGIGNEGNEVLIVDSVKSNAFDLSSISVATYPRIRLNAYLEDPGNFTPPIIDRWMVTYGDEIPEGTLVVDKDKVGYNTEFKLQEGDSLLYAFQFKNIGEVPFKSPLIVRYTLKGSNGKSVVKFDTISKALLPSDTINLRHYFTTKGLAGTSQVEIFVNPNLQKELLFSNNSWTSNLTVKNDKINPVMDVTFDGKMIMNGEIVSPTPNIVINIRDENKFFIKTDTVGIKLLFKKNCNDGCKVYSQISLQDPKIKYYPATKEENNFRIEYTPEKYENGKYTLCVQGADASGNYTGIDPYCVEFEVINESEMTLVYPFPNPFTNYTRFVFTITGENIPDEMKIQILTISGKVVKEILQSDIGPLRVGSNITSYAWDGTDEYGDRLANGVYLYKVFAYSNGQKFGKKTTDNEKSFKEGWGKVVILR